MRLSAICLLATFLPFAVAAENFRSDSKRFGNPMMDIVLTETERLPRVSVVDIQIKSVGSSVGSSFFIACSLLDLARQRGNFRYISKLEDTPGRNQMLVGFLASANEAPGDLDARLAGKPVVDLEQFSMICAKMK